MPPERRNKREKRGASAKGRGDVAEKATKSKVRVPAAGSSRRTMPSRSCMTSRVCSSCISSGSMPLAQTFSTACAAGLSPAGQPLSYAADACTHTPCFHRLQCRRCNSDRPPREPRHQCLCQSPTGSRASRQQCPAPHSPCRSPGFAAAPQRQQILPEILGSGLSLGDNRLPSRRQWTLRGRWRPPAPCQGRHIPTARPAAPARPCLGDR